MTEYTISFSYSSPKDISITVFFMAKEEKDELTNYTKYLTSNEEFIHKCYKCPKGRNHLFPENIIVFRPGDYDKIEKFQKVESDVSPLIIKLESIEKQTPSKVLYYYCTFVLGPKNEIVKIKIFSEKLEIDKMGYLLEEVYTAESDLQNKNDELVCVICFGVANILLYPCRHYCLCTACSNIVKNDKKDCPICRKSIEKFLSISPSS